jgi:uncharacterized protein (DUF1778 family)
MAKIPNRRRPDYLLLRLTEVERRIIEWAARADGGESASAWIRSVVLPEAASLAARTRASVADRIVRDVVLSREGR